MTARERQRHEFRFALCVAVILAILIHIFVPGDHIGVRVGSHRVSM